MSEGTPQERLERALAKLPGTSECIAAFLKKIGIKGRKCKEAACPLANYFKKETGMYTRVPGNTARNGEAVVNLPYQAIDFVNKFDLGSYPDLEV